MHSQGLEDAVRYSGGDTQGTARFKAMAGAFGALGADISGISINPAGAAIFNTSQGVLSASTKNNQKDALYGGGMANSSSNN
ncbi:MAG: aromatic hydrocarbon degradation protein, partial [Bacteroidota bacterium]|nr:aromatic hydrocarbon degradation protein [Bacteroidota bacterium]